MADRRGRRSENRAPGGGIAVHYNSQIRILLSDGMAVKKKRRVYNMRIVCLGRIGKRMENIGRQRPIGVFDSGIGGLTNVRALMERLPM
ncbi:TPA: glutamate racemase, partial [Neisseria gonorrhoeae]